MCFYSKKAVSYLNILYTAICTDIIVDVVIQVHSSIIVTI